MVESEERDDAADCDAVRWAAPPVPFTRADKKRAPGRRGARTISGLQQSYIFLWNDLIWSAVNLLSFTTFACARSLAGIMLRAASSLAAWTTT